MHQYQHALRTILEKGERRPSRAKLADGSQPDTIGVFGLQMTFDLSEGFPLVTTKKVGTKGFVTELLWFLRGDTNLKFLHEHNCHIWDLWADENGDLGPVYGSQWRRWRDEHGIEHDQITKLECDLRTNPFSRRHILTAWNVGVVDQMALPPCHTMAQFYVSADRKLSCQLYQRSADMFIGVPWNIASYALLTSMLAQTTGLGVGKFIHTFGDAHIYENHVPQVHQQLLQVPFDRPSLWLNPDVESVLDFTHADIRINNYTHGPEIKADVAV